ncbi:spike base protein, RCAP_Rcc01079 family [Albimonas pacifica]|uniref:Uncharacterized protein n=1 Tax=Albimonas pacifica TaxID=1114924 RepID=A0A1I3JLW8_9RHOB|nr:hypothetical protein [Albimonas pacifica]SFI61120.1 hypothetical protein SAMN05216258_10859 [Albimonas pacifica]
MSNPYNGHSPSRFGSVSDLVPVTPSDDDALPTPALGLYVQGAGAVSFIAHSGETRTVSVPANFYLICAMSQVLAAGTTATGIHALVL